jgi:two-component system NtrC family sensor kinase
MKKVLLIGLVALISFVKTIAQNNFPPAYEIKTDTAVNISLDDAYWQMLEDRAGELTFDQVSQSPLSEKFHPNNTKEKGIDFSIQTYWVRYKLRNSMTNEARITMPKNATEVDLYTRSTNEKWNHKRTGTGVPWSKRSDLKRITTVNYIIQPGEELLVYERDNFNYYINRPDFLKVDFGFTDKAIKEYYDDNDSSILPSFLFGFFLLAALFNLYFFLIVRGRVYLFFSLTLLFRGFSRFLYSNDIFLREHPIVKWDLAHVGVMFFFFFLIHFIRHFLETFKYYPRWDKYLIGLSSYNIIFFILSINNIISVKYQDVLGPQLILFFILVTLILFLRSNNKTVRLAIVAVLPAICIMSMPSLSLFRSLNEHTGIPIPGLIQWMDNRFDVLEQIGLVWVLIFFSWSLFQRYQQLQKQVTTETLAKERLAKEKEIERSQLIAQQKVDLEKQVTERTAELKQSLENLKATQSQLVQSEKMASLGELTAGIAHEIQNPLNFINNFSEVNKELLAEMKDEIDKGNTNEVKAIANDIIDNEEKINHHGKRADAIVKGMLQHSRTSAGQKEPTDINALSDEYLRLSYHGFRAKDKTFNATLQTNFDESIGKINMIPQDIGRVLLNLYNNAFYAVSEKKKQQVENYEPTVSITTKHINSPPTGGVGSVMISVKDNGNGIPQKVLDKIFQPFFTTKPTGQGTGLGLSLSYDIIKAHGGEIKVDTKEGEGSEFIVNLSI